MDKKVKNRILIIYIITFVISLIGATYAYFTVVKVNATSPEAEITSATSEVLSFSIGNDLYINGSYNNFQEGMSSLVSETIAQAYMRFDGGTRIVKHKYDLFIEIDENEFEYTTANSDAELILKIVNPNNQVVNTIEGLTYVSDQQGFDITTKTGKYYIAKEFPLETDTEVTQDWNVSVVFVNLNEAQNGNYGKMLNAHLTIERSENDAR